jgi:hypothetical protein
MNSRFRESILGQERDTIPTCSPGRQGMPDEAKKMTEEIPLRFAVSSKGALHEN